MHRLIGRGREAGRLQAGIERPDLRGPREPRRQGLPSAGSPGRSSRLQG